MSSTEATNGISRRAVLAGAAAIGGTIAVASALGTGVSPVQIRLARPETPESQRFRGFSFYPPQRDLSDFIR